MVQQAKEQRKIKASSSREMLKGAYANYMLVRHSAEEFVLDFFNVFPPEGALTSRVIVSPTLVGRIVEALQKNVSTYEDTFGEIKQVKERKYEIGFQK